MLIVKEWKTKEEALVSLETQFLDFELVKFSRAKDFCDAYECFEAYLAKGVDDMDYAWAQKGA